MLAIARRNLAFFASASFSWSHERAFNPSAILLAFCIGGCGSGAVGDPPLGIAGEPADPSMDLKSHIQLIRSFDRSLTPAEKEAAITELQKDKDRVSAKGTL